MQVPILSGVYSDAQADYRTVYPRNLYPVAKPQGISAGYLRPAHGIVAAGTGPGVDRGGILWNGALHRVMGDKLVSIAKDGTCTVLATIPGEGQVTLDYGFDSLAIAANRVLYYWDGSALTAVTDPDIGAVLDVVSMDGYFITHDGTNIVTTDLADKTSVNPLHYGSSEADPDRIVALDKLNGELHALNRYTWEVFQNVGGDGFPFQRVPGAVINKGVIGTHAYANTGDSLVLLGSGRNEAPGVYRMAGGALEKVSTREIDTILSGYSEEQLAGVVAEALTERDQQQIRFHLPDQTLVFDPIASRAAGQWVWFPLTSSIVGLGTYRARNAVWAYDRWNVGDPTSDAFGVLSYDTASHFGQVIGWDFGVLIVYAEGNDGIVHEIELVCLTGRVSGGVDPVIWTSYSHDGQNWSQERPTRAGRQGQRMQRICWRTCGTLRHQRMQRFRGTSDAFLSMARLEVAIEPLITRPGNG